MVLIKVTCLVTNDDFADVAFGLDFKINFAIRETLKRLPTLVKYPSHTNRTVEPR